MPRPALALSVLAALLPLVVPAHARAAARATVSYAFPTADQGGITASAAGGFAVCGGGLAGAGCRTPGLLEARTVARLAIPAWGAADLLFTAPPGTTIAGGTITVRYRVATPDVHARLLYRRSDGSWNARVLTDRSGWTTAALPVPAGVRAIGPSLYARRAVASGAVATTGVDAVRVVSIAIDLLDATPPALVVSDGPLVAGGWQRGSVCGEVSATDVGLGVQRVVLEIDAGEAEVDAPPSSLRPAPRPRSFAGQLCVDTMTLHDGYLTGALMAQDGVDESGNRSLPTLISLQVDNTAPTVTLDAPAESEETAPALTLRVEDAGSGVASATAAVDGEAVTLDGDGPFALTLPSPLAYGSHLIAWTASDQAGNVTSGSRPILIVDRTPPALSVVAPADGAVSDPAAVLEIACADAGSGVARAGLAVALDGLDIDAAGILEEGTFRYQPPRPLPVGRHHVRASATDRAGNTTTVVWSFRVEAVGSLAYSVTAPRVVGIVSGRPATVRVVVRLGADPAEGVRIIASWPGGRAAGSATTDADGVGAIVLDGSRAGRLRLRVDGVVTTVRVVLRRGITLAASSSHACASCAVTLSGQVLPRVGHVAIEAYHGGSWHLVRSLSTGRGGAFRTRIALGGPGLYVLRATTGTVRSAPVQVWVAAGAVR